MLTVGLEPQAPLHYFEEISKIPRPSKHEGAIADYLVKFAEDRNLAYHRDKIHNVVIRKNGVGGGEERASIMLQGHTDMVCEQNAGTGHDFMNDGINLVLDGNALRAAGTTLGADNGVAVSYMLALLDSDSIPHPPLECVFTSQEEIGLIGAEMLDEGELKSKTLINIDGGPFGTAIISCAGGMRVKLKKQITPTPLTSPHILEISVRGLIGGHSGVDIDLGRGNANKIMGRLLHRVLASLKAELVYIKGGAKDNAIPRECDCLLAFDSKSDLLSASKIIDGLSQEIVLEYQDIDPALKITATPKEQNTSDIVQYSFGIDASTDIVNAIYLAPNGVKFRSPASGGFVVSSTNLGVIDTEQNTVSLTFSPRSSVSSLQDETFRELQLFARLFNFEIEHGAAYPGWSYAPVSPIRDTFKESFRSLFGEDLKTEAIHAGLECGLFADKVPGLDAIAFGPDVHNPHTPDEWLDIESFKKVWLLLLDVLKRMAVQ